jgi:hypothetical protein
VGGDEDHGSDNGDHGTDGDDEGNGGNVDDSEDDDGDNEGEDYYDGDKDPVDDEDVPLWNFAADEELTSVAEYTFCPAAHRTQILRLITKHFCGHPLFKTRSGQTESAAKIRITCVREMYQFCHTRNLREVWGYLWMQWYTPLMWSLWARSASPYLSRLRTTMTAENHWKQIKHHYLHHLSRPRLDLTVYIICTEVAPDYLRRAREHCDSLPRGGRHLLPKGIQEELERPTHARYQ